MRHGSQASPGSGRRRLGFALLVRGFPNGRAIFEKTTTSVCGSRLPHAATRWECAKRFSVAGVPQNRVRMLTDSHFDVQRHRLGAKRWAATYVGGKKNKPPETPCGGGALRSQAAVSVGCAVAVCAPRAPRAIGAFPIIAEHILPASIVYTDEYPIYEGIHKMPQGYEHRRVNHAAKIYVMGDPQNSIGASGPVERGLVVCSWSRGFATSHDGCLLNGGSWAVFLAFGKS